MSLEATVEALTRRVERLERELREARNQPQARVLGTQQNPMSRLYISDPKTGSIGSVTYDSASNAVVTSKER